MAVSDTADQRAWANAKSRYFRRIGNRPVSPASFFRTVEEIKELELSGNPNGSLT